MTVYWAALAAAITTSLIGQVLLKSGASGAVAAEGGFIHQLFRLPTMVGLVCYGGAALLYIVALRKIPMSVALPCTAASYVAIAAIGYFMFGEPLGAMKLAAIALICGGVSLMHGFIQRRLRSCVVVPRPVTVTPPTEASRWSGSVARIVYGLL